MATHSHDEYHDLPTPYRLGVWFRLFAFLAVIGGLVVALIVRGWSFYFVPALLAALALVPTKRETLAERLIDAVTATLRPRRQDRDVAPPSSPADE